MAKFGEITATQVWAAATRTLTDLDLHDLVSYPVPASGYPTTTITTSASADTFGSWTQLVADVGTGKQLRGVMVSVAHGFQVAGEIEVGVGGAGAEAVIYRFAARNYMRTDVGWFVPLWVPVEVLMANNARLSARARSAQAAANDFYVSPVVA